MKNKIIILSIIALLCSALFTIVAPTAEAAGVNVSISGPSSVEIGQTYTYNITVSGTATSIGGTISCSGGAVSGNNGTFWADSPTGTDQSITATGAINITVSESASSGNTATISVTGNGSSVDGTTFDVAEFSISGSKTISVISTATPTPKPTAKPTKKPTAKPTQDDETDEPTASPTATPAPTPSPTPNPDPSSSATDNTPEPVNDIGITGIWDQLNTQINSSTANEVTITVDSSCIIPSAILSSLKNTGSTLKITAPSYRCSIDGNTINTIDDTQQNISLDMVFYKDTNISTASGNKDDYQLHFGNDVLPAVVSYTFSIMDHPTGTNLHLYYYYPNSNVLEYMYPVTIAEDGTVTLDIYHFSSYVLSDEIIATAFGNPVASSTTVGQSEGTKKISDNPMNLILLILFVGLIVILYILLMIKLFRKRRPPTNYISE